MYCTRIIMMHFIFITLRIVFSLSQLKLQLSKSLGTMWPKETTPPTDTPPNNHPLPTVRSYIIRLNSTLDKCGKTARTGSKQHRLVYTTQQEYNKVINKAASEHVASHHAHFTKQPQPFLSHPFLTTHPCAFSELTHF